MLRFSKFVNTKAVQKDGSSRKSLQLPIFNKSEVINPVGEDGLSETALERVSAASKGDEILVKPIATHASVNFEELQRQEDLQKKNQDWLAFFLGVSTATDRELSEKKSDATVGLTTLAPLAKPIIMPVQSAPEQTGPACLDDIFRELISEDKVFTRRAD
jgi:hypothetical protein